MAHDAHARNSRSIERRYAREAERFGASLLLTPAARIRQPVAGPDVLPEHALEGVAELMTREVPALGQIRPVEDPPDAE